MHETNNWTSLLTKSSKFVLIFTESEAETKRWKRANLCITIIFQYSVILSSSIFEEFMPDYIDLT